MFSIMLSKKMCVSGEESINYFVLVDKKYSDMATFCHELSMYVSEIKVKHYRVCIMGVK